MNPFLSPSLHVFILFSLSPPYHLPITSHISYMDLEKSINKLIVLPTKIQLNLISSISNAIIFPWLNVPDANQVIVKFFFC